MRVTEIQANWSNKEINSGLNIVFISLKQEERREYA